MFQVGIVILKLMDSVLVLFTLCNQLVMLGVKGLDLFPELAVLFFKISHRIGLFVRGFLVSSKVVLKLQMGVFGGVVDLGQGSKFLLELFHLLCVVTLLSLSHFGLQR
jgi:hypothetical protein